MNLPTESISNSELPAGACWFSILPAELPAISVDSVYGSMNSNTWQCLSHHRRSDGEVSAVLAVSGNTGRILLLFSESPFLFGQKQCQLSGPALMVEADYENIPTIVQCFEDVLRTSPAGRHPVFQMLTHLVAFGFRITCHRRLSFSGATADYLSSVSN